MRTRLLAGAIAGALALAVAGCSAASHNRRPRSQAAHLTSASTAVAAPGATITVDGTGQVTGTPDTLNITFAVDSQAAHAAEALNLNNARTAALIHVLKARGVRNADIQTSQLSVNPTYSSNGQTITGYQVEEQVTAALHDLRTAGATIDAAAGASGDAFRIYSLSFSFANDSALLGAARAQAVTQARDEARQLATAAGTTLGPVRSITETSASPNQYPYPVPFGAQASARSAVPVQPGSQQLQITVHVVYSLG